MQDGATIYLKRLMIFCECQEKGFCRLYEFYSSDSDEFYENLIIMKSCIRRVFTSSVSGGAVICPKKIQRELEILLLRVGEHRSKVLRKPRLQDGNP